ncbi:MAG: hypothetical protein V4850_16245 [Myxococcota bacterium]
MNVAEPRLDPPRWIPWREIAQRTLPQLERRGAYVIARMDADTAASAPDVTLCLDDGERGVVYIGESHGRTASLGGRLFDFGSSAGFSVGLDRHYAASGFRDLAGARQGSRVVSDDVYVALFPVPERDPIVRDRPDAPGVLPALYEATLLWAFVERHGHVPRLNNAGNHGGADIVKAARDLAAGLAAADIAALLQARANPAAGYAAAARLAEDIAVTGWGYGAGARVYRDGGNEPSCWSGRHLGGGTYAYVGWRNADGFVFVSIWKGNTECVFGADDEGAVPDESSFRALVERLYVRWR